MLCEGGAYRGVRGGGMAVDKSGKKIREFKGDSGDGHMKNFFDAVRATTPRSSTPRWKSATRRPAGPT